MFFSKHVCQITGESSSQTFLSWAARLKSLGATARQSGSIARGLAAILAVAASVYVNPAWALGCSQVYALTRGGVIFELDESDASLEQVTTASGAASAGTDFNPFGVSAQDRGGYAGRQRPVDGYERGTVRSFSRYGFWNSNSPAPDVAVPWNTLVAGAVNPVNNWFYMAGPTNDISTAVSSWYVYAYNPATPDVGAIKLGQITDLLGNNGDLAFDSQGNMYVVAGSVNNTPKSQIFRVGQVPPHAGTADFPATVIAEVGVGASNENTVGIALNSSGQLVLSTTGGFFQWFNPLTGELIRSAQTSPALTGDNTIVDLGSCADGNTVTLRKFLPDGRAANTDQFTIALSGGGLPGIGSGDNLSVTTAGTQSGLQDEMVGPLLSLDGVSLTINEVAAGTTNLADYTRSWMCIDEADNDAVVASGTSLPATITMPTPDEDESYSVVCTITNARFDTPSLMADKYLPNGRAQAGDQFTLSIAQGNNVLASVTTEGSTKAPLQDAILDDDDAAVGVTYTVSEVAAGTADMSQYASSYECRNFTEGGQTPSGIGTSFNITLSAGDELYCRFTNTPLPVVNLSKVAQPVTGTPVLLGQLLTYTLTAQVINGPTLSPVVLEDQLGDGLTFVEVISPGAFTYNPVTRTFTMPAGQPGGTYAVSYTARVDSDATVSVNNSVTGTGGGDPANPTNPVCAPGACATEHPIPETASLVLAKRLPNGRLISTDQFTLTIAQGGTTESTVTTTGSTTAPTQQASVTSVSTGVPYTLTETASGTTVLGDYASRYECVNSKPGGQNPSGSGTSFNVTLAADDDLVCTFINSVAPSLTVSKGASPFNGNTVQLGQLIGYTLYTEVVNGPTLSPVVLTDQLGDGLSFVQVQTPGQYTYDAAAGTFTLPAGRPSGIYAVTYLARVDVDTDVLLVNNSVSGTGGGDPLNPTNPTCDGYCTTSHPIERATPTATVSKSANPASGTAVEPGQTISYTLSVQVSDGPTVSPIVLTDELGAGLTFGAVTNAGNFTYNTSTRTFNLPAGQATGTHSVTYTATVDADASVSVGNFVRGTMAGDLIACQTTGGCQTTHPIDPIVGLSKTSVPVTGTAVEPGELLTYTLTVTVANGPTQSDVVLTDTLGTGLEFVAVINQGEFDFAQNGNVLTFTLPEGADNGTYSVVYTATVAETATVGVSNTVTGTGGGNPDLPTPSVPECAPGECGTVHPIDPIVSLSKTSVPATGTAVEPGELLTYTLTVTVANGPTQSDVVLTDTLGTGLEFVAVTNQGEFDFAQNGNVLTFTLPEGADNGTYNVTYTATVAETATVGVSNTVTGTGGGNPDLPTPSVPECAPGECGTVHPIIPAVLLSKTADPDTGTPVKPGDLLTYTLKVEVVNGPTLSDVVLTDTLGDGLTFVAVTDAGDFTHSQAGNVLSFTLAEGAESGDYYVSYTATVNANATVSVNNTVSGTGGGDPGNPTNPSCTPAGCETTHPIVPLPPGVVTPVPLGSVHWNALLAGLLGLLAIGGARRRGRRA